MSFLVRTLTAAWNRACVVPVLLVLGERALHLGRLGPARRRFLDAVRRAPACFRAHFGLARVHAAAADGEAARRELVIARHLAPSRFRELRRALPPPYRDEEHLLDPALGARVVTAEVPPRADHATDDFVDAEERARFRSLGPIRDGEARDVDWERLLAELLRRDD